MLAHEYLLQWINWIMPLIGTGATLRVVYISFQKITNPEDTEDYNKKIKKTIKAAIILISIPAFINFIKRYY